MTTDTARVHNSWAITCRVMLPLVTAHVLWACNSVKYTYLECDKLLSALWTKLTWNIWLFIYVSMFCTCQSFLPISSFMLISVTIQTLQTYAYSILKNELHYCKVISNVTLMSSYLFMFILIFAHKSQSYSLEIKSTLCYSLWRIT